MCCKAKSGDCCCSLQKHCWQSGLSFKFFQLGSKERLLLYHIFYQLCSGSLSILKVTTMTLAPLILWRQLQMKPKKSQDTFCSFRKTSATRTLKSRKGKGKAKSPNVEEASSKPKRRKLTKAE